MAPPVTFQILSDTHLECSVKSLVDMLGDGVGAARVLCLLGDIGSPFQASYVNFLKECAQAYEQVLVLSGNHEYYNTYAMCIADIDKGIVELCERCGANVHFLNNQMHVIDDVAFIGSTLWTQLPEEHKHAVAAMYNDYNFIYCEPNVKLHPDYTNKMFQRNLKFLESAINDGVKQGLKNVLLTHHTPTFNKTAPKFDTSLFRFGLSTELSPVLEDRYVKYWAFGHTHVNCGDMDVRGTKLICNQFGRKTSSLLNFDKKRVYTV